MIMIHSSHESHCLQESANPCGLRFGVALSPRSIVWGCQDSHCGLRPGFVQGPLSTVMLNIFVHCHSLDVTTYNIS